MIPLCIVAVIVAYFWAVVASWSRDEEGGLFVAVFGMLAVLVAVIALSDIGSGA